MRVLSVWLPTVAKKQQLEKVYSLKYKFGIRNKVVWEAPKSHPSAMTATMGTLIFSPETKYPTLIWPPQLKI